MKFRFKHRLTMVRRVRAALLSFIHPSPDFSEIYIDGELKLLMFSIGKGTVVTINRDGVYNHLIPVEMVQRDKVDLDKLPLFKASKTKVADKALLEITVRYVEATGKSALQLRSMYAKPDSDPWIVFGKEGSDETGKAVKAG